MYVRYLVLLLFPIYPFVGSGQSELDAWNQKYKPLGYKALITAEKRYAAQVETNAKLTKDYYRFDTYRLSGVFTGKSRPVRPETLQSMKIVCWAFPNYLPAPEKLDELVKLEYQFLLDGVPVWLPVQQVLEKPLLQDVRPGDKLLLYCLFFNDHREGKPMYNTLLLSEFIR
jgi:hypothetical protein